MQREQPLSTLIARLLKKIPELNITLFASDVATAKRFLKPCQSSTRVGKVLWAR